MSVGSHHVRPILKDCPCVECWSRLRAEWNKRYGPEVWPSHFHTLFGAVQVQHPQNVGPISVPDKPQEPVTLAPKPLRCGKDPVVDAPRRYYQGSTLVHCDCMNCCTCPSCRARRSDR